MTIEILPLESAFGAEIVGIDPRRLPDNCGAVLREALDKYRLVVLRCGVLEPEEQVAIMATLDTPLYEDGSGNPWSGVDKVADVFIKGQTGLVFHSDYHFTPQGPARYLSFNAIEVSEDEPTLFVDMIESLQRLPEGLRHRLERLEVLQAGSYSGEFDPGSRVEYDKVINGPVEQYPQAWQPAIRHHPFTRERLLNVNQFFSIAFSGMDRDQSQALLAEIDAHAYPAEATVSRGHRNGDLCIWDNIALQHGRPALPSARTRRMRRVAVNNYSVAEMLSGVRPAAAYAQISRSPVAEPA